MKYIEKKSEPEIFTQWKDQASDDWQPTWENLQNPEKQDLHEALIHEQGSICCYCCDRIDMNSSHIEHLRPRSQYPDRSLDYMNLLASCHKEIKPKQPIHCGHKKKDWFEEDQFISPLDPICEHSFRYTEAGEILPTDDPKLREKAQVSIDQLNLAGKKLILQREGAIQGTLEDLDELDLSEKRSFVQNLSQRDSQGQYARFYVALVYVLSGHLDIQIA